MLTASLHSVASIAMHRSASDACCPGMEHPGARGQLAEHFDLSPAAVRKAPRKQGSSECPSILLWPVRAPAASPSVRVRSLAAGVIAQLQLTFGLGPELGIVPFRAASLLPKLQGSLLDLLMMGCAERVHGVSSRILARMDR